MSNKILIVDDDPNARVILRRILEKSGYEVKEAGDGTSGLELARSFLPDVMLVDWMMPEMDGEQLAKSIRNDSTLKYTYIILLTAKGDTKDRVRGLQAGADDYITKPAPHLEVLARIESGIRVRELHGEIQQLTRRLAILELSATVGHEINNPLNVIYLAIDMMRKSLKAQEYDKLGRGIELIAETADRLKDIAKRFIDLRDPQSTDYVDQMKMIDIHKKDEKI